MCTLMQMPPFAKTPSKYTKNPGILLNARSIVGCLKQMILRQIFLILETTGTILQIVSFLQLLLVLKI